MPKATITRIFIGSVIAVVAGAVLALSVVWMAYASDAFVMTGPDVTGIRGTSFAWAMVGLAAVAGLVIIGGLIGAWWRGSGHW
jgi:hypothetical protein